jgi:uncharacterized membrane protein YtjA (UPF0391 family)
MFKYAVVFLIISLIAGAVGMSGLSQLARRISLALFALFFVLFLAAVGFALLVERAINPPPTPLPAMLDPPGITAA